MCTVLVVGSRVVARGERQSKECLASSLCRRGCLVGIVSELQVRKEVCLRLCVSCWIPSAPSRPPPPSARRRCRARPAEAESRRIPPGDLPMDPAGYKHVTETSTSTSHEC